MRGTDEADIAIQLVPGGVRTLINIDSVTAPERYEFRLQGDIARLIRNADGSVAAYDRKNNLIGGFAKPWARDALGRAVPTRYETLGTTLVQVVEHRSGTYTYGITADPLWLGPAIRACIAVRCYRWWPKQVARELQHGHITPAVKALLWGWFCKKTVIC
ncbi:hypothetical protein [Nonomuraea ceibae]|uniref:hypothetical protein n=1 Tax=Nonomuraea ceibae TaxID=1935170 RepID=UPI001C5DD9A8|nr:hypothetical protein [Nonomuraea ceibae]